jgi:hypothetical protein
MTGVSEPRPEGWEIHRSMQLESALATTPQERLEWLEGAIRFAFAAGALPRPEHSAGRSRRSKKTPELFGPHGRDLRRLPCCDDETRMPSGRAAMERWLDAISLVTTAGE